MALTNIIGNEIFAGDSVNITVTSAHPKQSYFDWAVLHRRLLDACREKNIDRARELLQSDHFNSEAINWTDASDQNNTALLLALKAGCTEIAEMLFEHPLIDLGVKNSSNETAILLASRLKDGGRIATLMLDKPGINMNVQARNQRGDTALHVAIASGYTEVVRLMLNYGGGGSIDMNMEDSWHITPLTRASAMGATDIVRLLLDHGGSNVNAQDQLGRTPLMVASWNGHIDIVRLLLGHGDVDVNARNYAGFIGESALSKADNPQIAKLLRDHGATSWLLHTLKTW